MKQSQFGDFQTPRGLVKEIIESLGPIGERWSRVLEPTCGQGNFIRGLLESVFPPKEIVGIELQDRHVKAARSIASPNGTLVSVIKADLFRTSARRGVKWKHSGPLLVIGNPPWVTNSAMGTVNGKNLPRKSNFMGMSGIDAITGSSNFDIAEYIWIKLLSDLAAEDVTFALLCKTSVARKVLSHLHRDKRPVSRAEIRPIDAGKWFGVSAHACLFVLELGDEMSLGASAERTEAQVFGLLGSSKPEKRIGFVRGKLVADLDRYESVSFIDGEYPVQWRQGVKHDAASVLELSRREGHWVNSHGESVEIEEEHIFPLLKSSHFSPGSGFPAYDRAIILPQRAVNQETTSLKTGAPKLWAYLSRHRSIFEARKSSVYRNKPRFSIFGIGDYSFAQFKVLVSGLHKEPLFRAVGPFEGKPVLCDDTCYLLPCESALQAAVTAALLNHPLLKQFIGSVAFKDAKRPITKAVLRRIDLTRAARAVPPSEVLPQIARSVAVLTGAGAEAPPQDLDLAACLGIPT